MLWLSLGENCLADRVLQRHKLKSFTTPFSHGRSNIDYILELENNSYHDLLNKSYLFKTVLTDGTSVVKSTKYVECDDIFEQTVATGFEFTHHDIIDNQHDVRSFTRRIERLKRIQKESHICFLYHYRYSEKMNIDAVIEKLNTFARAYTSDKYTCLIALLVQEKIELTGERALKILPQQGAVIPFIFRTQFTWGGKFVFPDHDDDLFEEMFSYLKRKEVEIAGWLEVIATRCKRRIRLIARSTKLGVRGVIKKIPYAKQLYKVISRKT